MKKLILFKSIIILLFFWSCKHSPTKQSKNPPTLSDYKIGETLTFKWVSTVDGEIRGEGEDIRQVVNYRGELGLWNGFDTLKIADILNQKQSETPYRDWPLEVGKKWKYESEWTNESGEKGITSQDVEILSFEEIELKAGKFMTYKMKYDGYIQNYEVGGKGKVIDTVWYSPKLKFNIRHTQESGGGFRYTNELINYRNAE